MSWKSSKREYSVLSWPQSVHQNSFQLFFFFSVRVFLFCLKRYRIHRQSLLYDCSWSFVVVFRFWGSFITSIINCWRVKEIRTGEIETEEQVQHHIKLSASFVEGWNAKSRDINFASRKSFMGLIGVEMAPFLLKPRINDY